MKCSSVSCVFFTGPEYSASAILCYPFASGGIFIHYKVDSIIYVSITRVSNTIPIVAFFLSTHNNTLCSSTNTTYTSTITQHFVLTIGHQLNKTWTYKWINVFNVHELTTFSTYWPHWCQFESSISVSMPINSEPQLSYWNYMFTYSYMYCTYSVYHNKYIPLITNSQVSLLKHLF